jgi:hypothetical protein
MSNRELRRELRINSENKKVAIVENGRDCDGVVYWGKVRIIPATVTAYNKLWNETYEWADGSFNFEIISPKEAKQIKSGSRDAAMEALEDGYPYCWYV